MAKTPRVNPSAWTDPAAVGKDLGLLNWRDAEEGLEKAWPGLPFAVKTAVVAAIDKISVPGWSRANDDEVLVRGNSPAGRHIQIFRNGLAETHGLIHRTRGRIGPDSLAGAIAAVASGDQEIERRFPEGVKAYETALDKLLGKGNKEMQNWRSNKHLWAMWLDYKDLNMPLEWWREMINKGSRNTHGKALKHANIPLAEVITGETGAQAQKSWRSRAWWTQATRDGVAGVPEMRHKEFLIMLSYAPRLSIEGQTALLSKFCDDLDTPVRRLVSPINWKHVNSWLDQGWRCIDHEDIAQASGPIPADTAQRFINIADSQALCRLAARDDLDEATQEALLVHPVRSVHAVARILVMNPKTSINIIRQALSDENLAMNVATAMNPAWSQAGFDVAMRLAEIPEASPHMVARALYYWGEDVTPTLLVTLAAAKSPAIRAWAREQLVESRKARRQADTASGAKALAR